MVLNKELTAELKKYNKELEKHLGGVDFGFIAKDPELFSKNDEVEFYALMGSNLVDIRTEIAILRKNFANDIENMVQRTISEQQQYFLSQTNKLYGQVVVDLKNNFAGYIKEMSSEISNLKKELVRISTNNNNFDMKMNEFKTDVVEFKSLIGNFESSIANLSKNDFNNKLDLIDSKIESLSGTSLSRMNLVQKNLLTLNQKIVGIEKNNLNVESNLIDIEQSVIPLETHIVNKKLSDGGPKIKNNVRRISVNSSNVDRILEIDSRIRNLESLK